MAITLLINPGSSSKKYSLIEDGRVVADMRFEQDANNIDFCLQLNGREQKCENPTFEQYDTAIRFVLDTALREKAIKNLQDITRVGVRVVAPGTFFQSHRLIDDLFIHKLREREPVAPLHIPSTLREVELVKMELPHAMLVGVSDSAFHSTMPDYARDYSIELKDTDMYDIHRFGYHGISNASVVRRTVPVFSEVPNRMVICHVGSGVSMTAVRNGESIDTTMGFSPGSGLVMGSRAGDIESGALLELMRAKNLHLFDAQTYIQTRGGLKGLTGEADFRHILERLSQNDEVATAAMDLFVYRFQKALGGFIIALGGLDAIVLTATAVERSTTLRSLLFKNLEWLGIILDNTKNESLVGHDGIISTTESKIKVAVIRTNEIDEMHRVTNAFVAPQE